MNILAFDTALESCSVAIQTYTGTVLYEHTHQERGQAEILIPRIEKLMDEAGLTFHDLNLLTTTIGPGSFTGLRVGLAAAQGYALSTGLPLVGLTTLEMIAHSAPSNGRRTLAIIDSKRGDFYYQIFDEEQIPLTQPGIIRPEDVAETIREKSLLLAGNAATKILPYLAHCDCEVYSEQIDARVLLRLAFERYQRNETTGHPNDCKPLYLREADAKAPSMSALQIAHE